MAELADAIDLGSIPKGWGFESLYPHHKKPIGCSYRFFMVFIWVRTVGSVVI